MSKTHSIKFLQYPYLSDSDTTYRPRRLCSTMAARYFSTSLRSLINYINIEVLDRRWQQNLKTFIKEGGEAERYAEILLFI